MSLTNGTRTLFVVLLVAALGIAAFVALWSRGGAEDDVDFSALAPREPLPAAESDTTFSDETAALSGSSDASARAAARARQPKWPVTRTDAIPRGGLDVKVLGPDGEPLGDVGLTLRLVRESAGNYAEPLPVFDRETGLWRFRDVVIGRAVVTVIGDHVVPSTARANVTSDEVGVVEVHTSSGGAIRYSATYYSGDVPRTLSLSLRGEDGKTPVKAWYQLGLTTPREALSLASGPKGALVGLAPGRYHLRAESEAGEVDLVPVDVEAGATATIDLQLRK